LPGSKKAIDDLDLRRSGLRIVGHSIRPRLSRLAKAGPRKASNNFRRFLRHRSTVRPAGCCMLAPRPRLKLVRSSCRFPGSCNHGEIHRPPSQAAFACLMCCQLLRGCECTQQPSAHEGQLDVEHNAHAGSRRKGCAASEVQDHTRRNQKVRQFSVHQITV